MKIVEALLDNDKIIFVEKPDIEKARILITFLDEEREKKRLKFPTHDLGKMKNISRKDIYDDYFSNWHKYPCLCV